MIKIQPIKVHVPHELMVQWRGLVDNMADLAGIPAGLIMRISEEDIEVFVSSHGEENPYHPGDREYLADSGLYCETVINTKRPLIVPDALADPDWKDNPDVKLNMISYMGFPILFPDGTPFGTLCILDRKPNPFSDRVYNLLDNFRSLVEGHLALLYMNASLNENYTSLVDYLNELRALRGLISICSNCKKIKDSDGHWHPVERYLVLHPDADFTHGYCPECGKNAFDELSDP